MTQILITTRASLGLKF